MRHFLALSTELTEDHLALPDAPALERIELPDDGVACLPPGHADQGTGNRSVWAVTSARWRLFACVVGALLVVCGLYCLLAPHQYEACARLALSATAATLNLQGGAGDRSGSFASGQTQLETLADILRSRQLSRRAIYECRLYEAAGFSGDFTRLFPSFRPDKPDIDAESYLEERFSSRLRVVTIPRTLVLEIRFRSGDPMLSAAVVNSLVRAYQDEEAEQRGELTRAASSHLQAQLDLLKSQARQNERRLSEFQASHRLLVVAGEGAERDTSGDAAHLPAMVEVDTLSKELATADSEWILRQAEDRAAQQDDPEAVLAFDPHIGDADGLAASFRSLHSRQEQLEQELAQLRIERGPNFPRVVEVKHELDDVNAQLVVQKSNLREKFKNARRDAEDHAHLVRNQLEQRISEGLKANRALATYETMRREADATQELYLRMQGRLAEASMAAGTQTSGVWVIDEARAPAKPVSPNPPLALAITLPVAIWLGVSVVFLAERLRPSLGAKILLIAIVAFVSLTRCAVGQAPTPSTSGLPTGVARIPVSHESKEQPNPKEAPAIWNGTKSVDATVTGLPPASLSAPLAAPIAPGDLLDVSEFHTPEFHTTARVSTAGTVKLPLIDEVAVAGLDELGAGKAISDALLARGMLNHPQVFVLVTAYAGQDVSVLGEVTRPGVYPLGVHHRLLDLLSAASGLTAYASARVRIYHRADPDTFLEVDFDGHSVEASSTRNPELLPGDTVRVGRAGLVYVVGDVIRPGGFMLEPSHQLTVLKALSLAWGPSQNAAMAHAILIREQDGGRTVTTLNLKRMLHGKDPDEPVGDCDILYVPNSTAKNLVNRTIESAIQSAAGVSIYAGMVYSQRF